MNKINIGDKVLPLKNMLLGNGMVLNFNGCTPILMGIL